ncbi:MAG: hypothetical protein V2I37_11655 [Marinilabiliaceae bacterium]|jgi:hypothetical protein|nr:hypothetical protein [Marinilabiliaceae bacterium]
MSRTFTQLITFREILTEDIDLYEDAFGYTYAMSEICNLLSKVEIQAPDTCIEGLLNRGDLH